MRYAIRYWTKECRKGEFLKPSSHNFPQRDFTNAIQYAYVMIEKASHERATSLINNSVSKINRTFITPNENLLFPSERCAQEILLLQLGGYSN